MAQSPETPTLTGLGKLVIVLFVLACLGGAYYLANKRHVLPAQISSTALNSSLGGGKDVQFGIAYGTEKQRWLEWAVQQYQATSARKHIQINLIPMASIQRPHPPIRRDHPTHSSSP